jgi:signal transduction histidine kinase
MERAREIGRRIAAGPHVPAPAAMLLGLGATAETILRTVGTDVRVAFGLVLCLVALATTLPPALLRPVPAATAVTAAAALSLAVFGTLTAAGLIMLALALFRLGLAGPAPLAPGLAVLFLPIGLSGPGILTVLAASLAPAAAWAGVAQRARGEARVHSAAREAVAGRLVEHTARGERARIARELHDVVAHHISMIAVQAETARLTTPDLPEAGARRFSEIGDTARAGLTEMRRLLGVLREDAGAEPAQRHPQPGLHQLNELLDEARDTVGAGARLILHGAPVELGPGVELAAYRIIQEALTNARRHAPGAAVDVELDYTGEHLLVRVRDNGPGPPEDSAGGHGLTGMRERAAAVGGELRTGRASVGGFLVEATLPIHPEEPG